VTLSGISALASVLIETLWRRDTPALEKMSTGFNTTFASSLGAYVAGFAALDAAIAFPLDSYWHSIYGVDVSIWAPFHVMFITGMSIVAGGAACMLISATNLALRDKAASAVRSGYVGVVVALATMMGLLMLFVPPSLGENGYINLGVVTIGTFPLLVSLFGAFALVAAGYVFPWRWAATSLVAVYLFFGLVLALGVPPMMSVLLRLEQQTLRPNASLEAISQNWLWALFVAAIILDLSSWFVRRKGWSVAKTHVVIVWATIISFVVMAISDPLFLYTLFRHPQAGLTLGVSLLPGVLGAYAGGWFGQKLGILMQQLER